MSYHIIFDLGDPDVIKPVNGLYSVNIVVFDKTI